ncbi:acyltransferase-like [Apium graveolens]|uniref:acyltransferase-like n=1 Tax=Apium graveolens TaxID=4045 RepID=UPI003D7B2BF7
MLLYLLVSFSTESVLANVLENSLSQTLSKYYPFAGRLSSSGSYVDCNDEGVYFSEARIGCKLYDVVKRAPVKEDEEGLGHLFPPHGIWDKLSDDGHSSLMLVQLNRFTCGGIAIAVSLSHRIGDALTLFSFLIYWAALSHHFPDHQKVLHLRPYFVPELLLQSDDDLNAFTANAPLPKKHWITKEMMFHNSSIEKLKAHMEIEDKLRGVGEINYTRNEVVSALIYRCAAAAAAAASAAAATTNPGVYAKSVLCQVVNMRPMIDPPLPPTSLGNFINYSFIPTSTENETDLNFLAEQIRKGKMQLRGSKGMDLTTTLASFEECARGNKRLYGISSLCNLPMYEMDFGWGKPVKATIVDTPLPNYITMMDTANRDGIKAIVGLEEQEMTYFQANKELLIYASF